MLFPYPQEALASNWLSAEVITILRAGMEAINNGDLPEEWPNCLHEERRLVLETRTGLKAKLEDFFTAYEKLSEDEKATVYDALMRQSDLPGVYSDHNPCPTSEDFPEEIKGVTRHLFDYLFDLLTEIKDGEKCLRDIQFDVIYDSVDHICPFCGLNYFRAPGAPRHALDHLMNKPRYPFSAADLRNLPPTCDECNEDYKGSEDILHRADGTRRRCSDPYLGPVFEVRLNGSQFFSGNEVRGWTLPRWEIELVGDEVECAETWDAVYHIKTRYSRDVLDADFLSWVKHFSRWYKRRFGQNTTSTQVADRLPEYIDSVIQDGFADRAFLKAAAFRFVHISCNDPVIGNDIREWLWSFVEYSA